MVLPNRHVPALADLSADELHELADLTQRAEAVLIERLPAAGHQRRHQPGPLGGRRHPRASARAPGAALERRHELHQRRRRDARAAGGPAAVHPRACARSSRLRRKSVGAGGAARQRSGRSLTDGSRTPARLAGAARTSRATGRATASRGGGGVRPTDGCCADRRADCVAIVERQASSIRWRVALALQLAVNVSLPARRAAAGDRRRGGADSSETGAGARGRPALGRALWVGPLAGKGIGA